MSSAQTTIEHGRLLEDQREWAAAIEVYSALLDGANGRDAEVAFRLGHSHFLLGKFEEATTLLLEATELAPNQAAWHYRLGFVLEQLGNYEAAAASFKSALALEPGRARWKQRLVAAEASVQQAAAASLEAQRAEARRHRKRVQGLVASKAPVWQQIDALIDGLPFSKNDPEWLIQLADAQFAMNRFAEAGENYAAAALMKPNQADLHFREGWCQELAGQSGKARRPYQRAVAADTELQAADFGVGVFFQKRGRWVEASNAYREFLGRKRSSAELHYRLGYALIRSYDWREALASLKSAVALDPTVPEWHYRLGFAHERLAEWSAAAAAYEYAVNLNSPAPSYWSYRLGYVLTQTKDFESACLAFASTVEPAADAVPDSQDRPLSAYEERLLLDALPAALYSQSARRCLEAGDRLVLRGMHALAAEAFDAAVKRQESHSPAAYYKLGRALHEVGDLESACHAYLETRLFKRAHGVNTAPYRKKKELKQSMIYTEFLETLPIAHSTVLYESNHGHSVSCNPLQICRNLLTDPQFALWTHVWVLNDKDRIPQDLAGRSNVIFIARDSELYLRYLSTAKYLINNTSFPPYFVRRSEQLYLNTWHGTPLKTLGKDVRTGFFEHRNIARNFLQTTHIIVPNEHTRNALIEGHDIQGLYNGKVALTGYPRTDLVVNATPVEQARIRSELGLDPADSRPVVLFAPTWRGGLESSYFDAEGLREDLERIQGEDRHVFLRAHRFAEEALSGFGLEDSIVPQHIDTNDLLAGVDVLITDYSSIFFDFLPTRREIVFYAPDLEQYQSDRGLYFDIETLPGRVCYGRTSLAHEVTNAVGGATKSAEANKKYLDGVENFCAVEDGSSTQRTVDFFFFNATEYILQHNADSKRNVLFFQGSFIPNGITTSYLNLVSNVDSIDNRLVLAIDPFGVNLEERRLEKFAQLPQHVQTLARCGAQLVTAEERWVIDKFNANGDLATPELWQIYNHAFKREFRRLFGDATFDSVVCFEGYTRYWAALFANPTNPIAKKTIYLHNDMRREWLSRFRSLESIFRLYRTYDRLMSVTKSVNEENIRQLAETFELGPEKFGFCNNVVNAAEAKELATDALDEDLHEWMDAGTTNFVTLGRLSPEKGHAKLLRAFAGIVETNPECKLTILGDGPLRLDLQNLIVELSLEHNVLLAGLRLNPFPTLGRADCFVFSSDYEGQGLVVLEALILGVPVISTDVVGPRSILEGGYGLLVENSVRGLLNGMQDFLAAGLDSKPFDYDVYQSEAVSSFEEAALQGN